MSVCLAIAACLIAGGCRANRAAPELNTSRHRNEHLSVEQRRLVQEQIALNGVRSDEIWFIETSSADPQWAQVYVHLKPRRCPGNVCYGERLYIHSYGSGSNSNAWPTPLPMDTQIEFYSYVAPGLHDHANPPTLAQQPFTHPDEMDEQDIARFVQAARAALSAEDRARYPVMSLGEPVRDYDEEGELIGTYGDIEVKFGFGAFPAGEGFNVQLVNDNGTLKVFSVSKWVS